LHPGLFFFWLATNCLEKLQERFAINDDLFNVAIASKSLEPDSEYSAAFFSGSYGSHPSGSDLHLPTGLMTCQRTLPAKSASLERSPRESDVLSMGPALEAVYGVCHP
jgi:hypothetical protein